MFKFRIHSIFLIILCVACNTSESPPEPIAQATPTPIINIEILDDTHQETKEISAELVAQNNCDGSVAIENIVEKNLSIIHIIVVDGGFEVNPSGQIDYRGTDVDLGTAVANRFGYAYGSLENKSTSITLQAPPGTNIMHHIRLQEIWEVGNANILVNDEELTIQFRFLKDFSLELVESINNGCPTHIPTREASTPTPMSVLNTPNPTDPPELTDVPASTETPISQSGLILTGDIIEISPPTSVNPDILEHNNAIYVFQEVQGFTLPNQITVNVSEHGDYKTRDEQTKYNIPVGTIIDSYFIHVDPIGNEHDVTLNGTITFENRIIGVILLATELSDSDLIVAAGTITEYPTGGVNRRFEFGDDKLIVSEDMRTITIEFFAGAHRDQIRVITESTAP